MEGVGTLRARAELPAPGERAAGGPRRQRRRPQEVSSDAVRNGSVVTPSKMSLAAPSARGRQRSAQSCRPGVGPGSVRDTSPLGVATSNRNLCGIRQRARASRSPPLVTHENKAHPTRFRRDQNTAAWCLGPPSKRTDKTMKLFTPCKVQL